MLTAEVRDCAESMAGRAETSAECLALRRHNCVSDLWAVSMPKKYDLEERLLDYASRIISMAGAMPRNRAANHIADQLIRSGTSAYGNHAEAEGAESRDDFIHKMRVCHKELRESRRWMKLVQRANFLPATTLEALLSEADELVLIFASSIRTAQRNGS